MVTGHRPHKLWGYDLKSTEYTILKNIFKKVLLENNCKEAISGMALGVDMVFALAVLELKEAGNNIELHCAIPCLNHSCKWTNESKRQYNYRLSKADKVKIVNEIEYKPWVMNKRNEYMVDLSDRVIAVWDGTSGGTKNCIDYVRRKQKELMLIEPSKITNLGGD